MADRGVRLKCPVCRGTGWVPGPQHGTFERRHPELVSEYRDDIRRRRGVMLEHLAEYHYEPALPDLGALDWAGLDELHEDRHDG